MDPKGNIEYDIHIINGRGFDDSWWKDRRVATVQKGGSALCYSGVGSGLPASVSGGFPSDRHRQNVSAGCLSVSPAPSEQ